jgi:hypothetical protein
MQDAQDRPDLQQNLGSIDRIERAILSGGTPDTGIRSRTARRWLNRLGYNWQDVKKGVFLDGHERDDVVEYRQRFLQEMEGLLPYLVKFAEDGSMQEKTYPAGCIVGGPDRRPIVMITHDESIFSANDGRHQAWVKDGDTILRPKGRGKGIMVSDFLLPWSRLNLLSLPKARQEELVTSGIPLEAAILFEYSKEDGYWDGERLLYQIVNRALPIAQALYPGYDLLFLFDNATLHLIYAKDALRTTHMNKGEGGNQSFLRNGWFENGDTVCSQEMSYLAEDPVTGHSKQVQKGIQRVLKERGLWPSTGLNLECSKSKCGPCQEAVNCKVCTRGTRCDSCKEKKVHSSKCGLTRVCDACQQRRARCHCVPKQYCPRCENMRKVKCADCESLPPKCSSTSNGQSALVHTVH